MGWNDPQCSFCRKLPSKQWNDIVIFCDIVTDPLGEATEYIIISNAGLDLTSTVINVILVQKNKVFDRAKLKESVHKWMQYSRINGKRNVAIQNKYLYL